MPDADPANRLAAALAAFQSKAPKIAKANTADTGTYKYAYADLSDISDKVLPLLGEHGLSFSAKPCLTEDGRFVLRYVLRHISGESDGGDYPLPSGNAQQIGSAITYARRYTLCAITGVAPGGDDDDGTTAKEVRVEAQPRPQEQSWDSSEQQVLYDGWAEEIGQAKTAQEIADIGKRILTAKRNGTLAPGIYQRLAGLGGRRKGELDVAAAKAGESS